MAEQVERKKVAVLGGGVGGMVSAYWLTSTPELRERFDVTVYQLGWRLGGKGASGRNAAHGDRIEEHGLHIWFGFYENAFFTLRQCYEELDRPATRGPDCPIRTFGEAFTPSPTIGLYEYYGGTWLSHAFPTPERMSPDAPELGELGPLPSLWHVISNGIEWGLDVWGDLRAELQLTGHELPKVPLRHFLHWSEQFGIDLDEFDEGVKDKLLSAVDHLGAGLGALDRKDRTVGTMVHHLSTSVLGPLVAFKDALWTEVVQPHVDHAGLRLFFTTFDTFLSAVVGILRGGVLDQGFSSIDHLELSAFLAQNGANPFTLQLDHSPFLRGWYDAAFAYRYVNGTAEADLAAGTGVHGILCLIGSYRRHIAFKMRAGMGDTIFGPLYEVLRARGVRVEFFREVTGLTLSADGSRVDGVTMVHQAELATGTTYDPLVEVDHLPCWPSTPRWDQLAGGGTLRDAGVDFEHGGRMPDAAEQVLRHGEEFHEVVLAIPAPALGTVCGAVAERSPRFRAMLDNCHSTMTQAGQVWTTTALDVLGARFCGTAIATSFVEPIDTYCDMSHLLPRESWGADPPLGVAYVCGVMPDQADQAAADVEVGRGVRALFRDHGTELWPKAVRNGAFDWSVLYDPAGRTGEDRFGAQYLRANFEPTERYVLSPAGSTVHRLRGDFLTHTPRAAADGPGIANLYLAGDWTLTGINGGCVEAATMSGMLVARALGGQPPEIVGEDAAWLARMTP